MKTADMNEMSFAELVREAGSIRSFHQDLFQEITVVRALLASGYRSIFAGMSAEEAESRWEELWESKDLSPMAEYWDKWESTLREYLKGDFTLELNDPTQASSRWPSKLQQKRDVFGHITEGQLPLVMLGSIFGDLGGIKPLPKDDPRFGNAPIKSMRVADGLDATYVLWKGNSFAETLIMNMTPMEVSHTDKPWWEYDQPFLPRKPFNDEGVVFDLAPLPPRRIRPTVQDGMVTSVMIAPGYIRDEGYYKIKDNDPTALWRTYKDSGKIAPLKLDSPLWREIPAIIAAKSREGTQKQWVVPSASLEWLSEKILEGLEVNPRMSMIFRASSGNGGCLNPWDIHFSEISVNSHALLHTEIVDVATQIFTAISSGIYPLKDSLKKKYGSGDIEYDHLFDATFHKIVSDDSLESVFVLIENMDDLVNRTINDYPKLWEGNSDGTVPAASSIRSWEKYKKIALEKLKDAQEAKVGTHQK